MTLNLDPVESNGESGFSTTRRFEYSTQPGESGRVKGEAAKTAAARSSRLARIIENIGTFAQRTAKVPAADGQALQREFYDGQVRLTGDVGVARFFATTIKGGIRQGLKHVSDTKWKIAALVPAGLAMPSTADANISTVWEQAHSTNAVSDWPLYVALGLIGLLIAGMVTTIFLLTRSNIKLRSSLAGINAPASESNQLTGSQMDYIDSMILRAKEASGVLAHLPTAKKNEALFAMADGIRKRMPQILEANQIDVHEAQMVGNKDAFVKRLTLNESKVSGMASSLEKLAKLPDPVGVVTPYSEPDSGIIIKQMSAAIGVIGVIVEARPNVLSDAVGACLKAGNAIIFRGGKEALRTNTVVAEAIEEALLSVGLPVGTMGFIRDPHYGIVDRMLQDERVNLVIPRGGPGLVDTVRKNARMRVWAHGPGVCHMYVDKEADLAMAWKVADNAKTSNVSVCNAMETLLVHKNIAAAFLPMMAEIYRAKGIELRGCDETRRYIPDAIPATAADWDTEYLDKILSIKVVASADEAIAHIARHGTGLAEGIVTADKSLAQRFFTEVNAGSVYHNCPTRFSDGERFGKGPEIGGATQDTDPIGPVGAPDLIKHKYVVFGNGQIV